MSGQELQTGQAGGALATPQSETAQALQMIERAASDPQVDTSKMRDLLEMRRELKAEHAEAQFAEALAAFQAECPPVQAAEVIRGKDGRPRSRFAPYAEIKAQVGPYLHRHGFSITRSQRCDDKTSTAVLTLTHRGGHSRTNEFTVRTAGGPPGTSAEQGSGSAAAFAARYALRDALDLVYIEPDNAEDERTLGGPLDPETAAAIRARVRAVCEGDDERERRFLKWAGVVVTGAVLDDHYEQIMSGRKAAIESWLADKGA